MLELMVSVAIIGLTVGIGSMEVLKNRPTHTLNKACWEIMSELREARTSAVSENKDCIVAVDSAAKTLTLSMDRNEDGTMSEGESRVIDLSDIPGVYLGAAFGDATAAFTGRGSFRGDTMTTQILAVSVPGASEVKYITIFPTGQVQMRNQ